MKTKQLITVIVPIFNAEETLERCVSSICSQTYSNLEIILINDGSTDNSGNICNSFVQKDERIIAIHQKNLGLSATRNVGIEKATGEYISFVDSDDWLELSYYSNITRLLPADIIVSGTTIQNKGLQSIVRATDEECAYIPSIHAEGLVKNSLYGYAWNKLYSAKLIKKMSFSKTCLLREDLVFNINAINVAEKVMLSKECGYNYLIRDDSILRKKYFGEVPQNVMDSFFLIGDIQGLSNNANRKIVNYIRKTYFQDVVLKYILENNSIADSEKQTHIKKILNNPQLKNAINYGYNRGKLDWITTMCIKLNMPVLLWKILKKAYKV